jgi:GPH family glycoside/pentoside/hexuronide:cation symporter
MMGKKSSEANTQLPPLSTGDMVSYGAVKLPLAMAGLPLALLVPQFYAGDMGLQVAAIGALILLARMTDVITDPLIGVLSDRTRSRFGRRRPYILLGLPLFLLSFWFLMVPGTTTSYLEVGACIALLYLGLTLIELPHAAWGAELSNDYAERTRLFGIREAFGQCGSIVAVLVPFLATAFFGVEGNRDVLRILAVVMGLLAIVAVLPALLRLHEAPSREAERSASLPQGSWRDVFKNGPFLRVFTALVITLLAVGMSSTLAFSWMRNVIGMAESTVWGVLLLAGVITLIGIPLWVYLANRFSKHRVLCFAYLGSAMVMTVGCLLIHTLANSFQVPLAIAMLMFNAFCTAGLVSLPSAILPDTLDLDVFRTGQQRSGLYFAVVGMGLKLAIGLGVAMAGLLISLTGFDMTPGVQAAAAIAPWVSVIALVIPTCLCATMSLLLWNFPLSRERHSVLLRAIARRQQRAVNAV